MTFQTLCFLCFFMEIAGVVETDSKSLGLRLWGLFHLRDFGLCTQHLGVILGCSDLCAGALLGGPWEGLD